MKKLLFILISYIVFNGMICAILSIWYDNPYIYYSCFAFLILMLAGFVILPILLLLENE